MKRVDRKEQSKDIKRGIKEGKVKKRKRRK